MCSQWSMLIVGLASLQMRGEWFETVCTCRGTISTSAPSLPQTLVAAVLHAEAGASWLIQALHVQDQVQEEGEQPNHLNEHPRSIADWM